MTSETITARCPVLGPLSILLPAFGAGLWLFFAKNSHLGDGLNGYAGLLICIALVGVSFALVVGGIVCSVTALIRRERWRFLAILGLLLNVGIVLTFRRW